MLRRSQRSAHTPACRTRSAEGSPSVNTTTPWSLSLRFRPSRTSHPKTKRWAFETRKKQMLLSHRSRNGRTVIAFAGRSTPVSVVVTSISLAGL